MGHLFARGQYSGASLYLKAMIRNLREYGNDFHYTALNKPVYRGLNPNSDTFKLEDYQVNSIG